MTFLLQHAPDDGSVTIREVTAATAVLNVCGPLARDVLQPLTWSDLGNAAFPYMTAQHVAIGHAPVLALRATYVGELGWELHVPVEHAADLYERIMAAGRELGIVNVGYRAVESLRLEKQYLAWAGGHPLRQQPLRGRAGLRGPARQAGAAGGTGAAQGP